MEIWVYSPGNLRGTGLLTISATVNAQGVVDLNETSPGQWEHLSNNLITIGKSYPKSAGLGFRVSSKHFSSLITLDVFPDHPNIFFIIPNCADASELQFTKSFPQFTFYAEVHSCNELRAIEHYRNVQPLHLAGYVAVAAEAGGRTGAHSAFMLLQEINSIASSLPVFLRGGIGVHTAGVLPLVAIAGIVLDDQVLLFPGSPLGRLQQEIIERLEGRESDIFTNEDGSRFRITHQHQAKATQSWILNYEKNSLNTKKGKKLKDIFSDLEEMVFFGDMETTIWPVGQMAGMAKVYKDEYHTLQRFVAAIRESIDLNIDKAIKANVLLAGNSLAAGHSTALPVVQGPMTRVSDSAEFAFEVAKSGGLPFIALALLKGAPLNKVLAETNTLLKDKSWGVGILGFVSPELREEQIREVLKVKPPFAIIAGGRPDHATILEEEGIRTYLHVPVPMLLKTFIRQGSTRFIFEGRECGGHVGPFNSFPLWEQMINSLLHEVPVNESEKYSILFAGGISNSLSAAMVAVLSAPLSSRGMNVGILMGTAYLACEETVKTGAITNIFQDAIINATDTTLLVSGPGHANRCVSSPFSDEFKKKRKVLLQQGSTQEQTTEALDDLLLGRLRVASKGILRNESGNYEEAPTNVIEQEGMFMAGEAANLLLKKTTLSALHEDVTQKAHELLKSALAEQQLPNEEDVAQPVDVAIIGMSIFVPGSQSTELFWDTILYKKNHITEIPSDRWDWRLLFDADPKAEDKIYSRWGGFMDDVLFDPLKYGIPPKSIPNITTAQLLALENVTLALKDAGLDTHHMDRENTSVIFATTDSGGFLSNSLVVRSSLSFFSEDSSPETKSRTQGWTEETFPGILSNVVSGRIANRLDFGGRNYAVDAACASSLVAVDLGVRELTSKRSKIVITGGIDVGQTPFGYLAFSKTGALSPTGESMPFDKKANGIVMSEGSAVLIMKRLDDAQKDGDKIYAVIKGIAGSSDGRAMGLTAPRSEGQQLSVTKAYSEAGFEPRTIGYYEAHGTGTMVGDKEELDTIHRTLKANGAAPGSVALGSVKSLIGHTKMAAGMVSLAKTALSLYYKVLPPQANVSDPLDKVRGNSPVFFYDKPVPWLVPDEHPRRAGVSAFGFGGANFHTVLEEYTGYESAGKTGGEAWPEELLVFGAATPALLLSEIQILAKQFEAPLSLNLRDLSWSLVRKYTNRDLACRISFTVSAIGQVRDKLEKAIAFLQSDKPIRTNSRIAYKESGADKKPKIAFLFSGQGSQHINMGREMALYFPEFRDNLELANKIFQPLYSKRFSDHIYPINPFDESIQKEQELVLNNTHIAQPAIGIVSTAYLDIFSRLGIFPDFLAGHSFGEITALHAAGTISRDEFFRFTEFRGRVMAQPGKEDGAMAAVITTEKQIQAILADLNTDIVIANYNGPDQIVISGSVTAIQKAMEQLAISGIKCFNLPVSAAFHSPMMAEAGKALNEFIQDIKLTPARIPVFSNITGKQFPEETESIRKMLCDHLQQPVQFMTQVEAMYEAGVRVFVELGPDRILTGLTGKILKHNEHTALSVDSADNGIGNFLSVLGRLWVEGVTIDLLELFAGRTVNSIDVNTIGMSYAMPAPKATSWIINGHSAKPVNPAFLSMLPQPLITADHQLKCSENKNNDITDQSISEKASTTQNNYTTESQNMEPQNTDAALEAYTAYQETMRQFLKTQEQVMSLFLTGEAAITSSAAQEKPAMSQQSDIRSAVATTPGARQEASAVPNMPAVPSVATGNQHVSEQTQPRENNTLLSQPVVPANTTISKQSAAGPESNDAIREILVAIISDRTGYPEDMISIDLDLEAELGVDSIKRMEIFGKFLSCLPKEKDAALTAKADRFVRIKKFKDLIDALAEELGINKKKQVPSIQN